MRRSTWRGLSGSCRSAAIVLSALALTTFGSARPAAAGGASPATPVAPGIAQRASLEGGSCNVNASTLARTPFSAFPAAGLTSSASSGGLQVKCALPYIVGKPGSDCNGWHTVNWDIVTSDGGAPDKVTAELVRYDVNGIALAAMPINKGDSAQLNSRLSPTDWKMTYNAKQKTAALFGPVPVLRVIVEDNGETATAYCSNIPFLEVVKPAGTVVTDEENGNSTDVVIAAPRTDPASLSFTIDGVNVLAAAGAPSPLTSCTAASPCTFNADVNGQAVTIADLVVDLAPSIGVLASNTVTFSVENQACGGHVYAIDGNRIAGSLRNPTSAACHVDDIFDKASSSVFGISITAPLAGDRLPAGSTQVTGEVCSGREITKATLNGKAQDLSTQSCIVLDAETQAGTCTLPIDDTLAQTDLLSDLDNTKAFTAGVMDLGANRLVASASDDLGNRAFKRVVFVSGDTLAPPAPINLQSLLDQVPVGDQLNKSLTQALLPQVQDVMNDTQVTIEKAFLVGMTAGATQELFTQLCNAPLPALKPDGTPNDANYVGLTPGQIFLKKARASLIGKSTVKEDVDTICGPDVDVTATITSVNLGSTSVACNVAFEDNRFKVTLGLDDLSLSLHAFGENWCDSASPDDWVGARVQGDFNGTIEDIKLEFYVTEDQLEGAAPGTPAFTFSSHIESNVDIGVSYCGLSSVCAAFVTIGTFGFVNLLDANFNIDFDTDFSKEVAGTEPDPVNLNDIKINEAAVENFGSSLKGGKVDVEIDATGIRATLPAEFKMTVPADADIDATLGAVLTPSSAVPTFAQMSAMKDVTLGLSDDVVNMLFASLTAQGALKGECTVATTVGALWDLDKNGTTNAADCDTLVVNNTGDPQKDFNGTVGARGLCYGIINADCETLAGIPGDDPNLLNGQKTAQGICHKLQGHNCLSITGGALEKTICAVTPNPNIHADQSILFCARQDLPARMLFADNAATTTAVEATLRMNDLSVTLVLDRTGASAGTPPDGTISTPLEQVPGCFKDGLNTTGDCNLFATCLDLSVDFAVEQAAVGNNPALGQCPASEPGFRNVFKTLHYTEERGFICGASGATSGTDGTVVDNVQTSAVTVDLQEAAEKSAPPICGAGLNLGIFGACSNAVINSMDATPGGLADFIGLTCDLVGLN